MVKNAQTEFIRKKGHFKSSIFKLQYFFKFLSDIDWILLTSAEKLSS